MRYLFGFFVVLFSCVANTQTFAGDSQALSFSWSAPALRENGELLAIADLGGYELRYKRVADVAYKTIVIPDRHAKSYELIGLPAGDYEFQIAAYDVNGLYSRFVPLMYKVVTAKPKEPADIVISGSVIDVVAACIAASPNCKVAVQGEWQ